MGIRHGFGGALTAAKVKTLSKPGHYADGGNLYLQISATGTKSWCLRFVLNGRRREMGLGKFPVVPLAAAREVATSARLSLTKQIDPIVKRAEERQAARLSALNTMSFRECARLCMDSKKDGWRNSKHAKQWASTLNTYVYPVIGSVPINQVTTQLVIKVLQPIWKDKQETATRIRSRIEAIWAWAKVREFCEGQNPATWKGHLDKIFVSKSRSIRVEHLRALDWKQIASFLEALRKQDGIAALAAEFTILNASRTGEVLGAVWSEFDLDRQTWSIPATRMKAGKPHHVPLSPAALDVLKKAKAHKKGDFVFPGQKKDRPLSNMAMLVLLRRMKQTNFTMHGFRSAFRDWAAVNAQRKEVAERCLAHGNPDKTEAAYFRDSLFEQRRKCMEAWALHCMQLPADGNVIPLRRGQQ